jgi:hypothetical protein
MEILDLVSCAFLYFQIGKNAFLNWRNCIFNFELAKFEKLVLMRILVDLLS